jgi:ABC-type nitrate/sulfonate/bicarbonate transport system permease component
MRALRLGSERLAGAVPIAAILLAWQAATSLGLVPVALLPPPATVLWRFLGALIDPGFLADAGATLLRLFSGFAVALVIGVTLGLAGATSRTFGAALRPLTRILAPVPKIALYPALILTLGFDHASKIVLVAADAVFPILLATYHGAATVEPKLIWSARAAGASRRRTVIDVVLPASLPSILTGVQVGLVVSCIVVFLAEMISSTEGLGSVLVRASRNFQTVDMFVPLIAISLLGLVLNGLLAAARRRLLAGFPEEP